MFTTGTKSTNSLVKYSYNRFIKAVECKNYDQGQCTNECANKGNV